MLIKTMWFNWTFLNFIVTRGYDDLSVSKDTQQYKTPISCPTCVSNNAVDRDIQTCARMEAIGTTSNDKSTWWHVDLGGRYNVYNIRIQFKDYAQYTMRQRGRFAGFSLYVSNTTDRNMGHLCYKDGPELPPLDFNINCITNGHYIIFYNERKDGIIYPVGYETKSVYMELCEVFVTGCLKSGVYGEHCNETCPDNCQEKRCDIINGTCFGCNPGWNGTYCNTSCPGGHYGLKCAEKCVGRCKDHDHCNHTTGLCDNGCADGWTGGNCTDECHQGTYGPYFAHKCSGHCLNNSTCNRTTGTCDMGCDSGYTGYLCDKVCDNGTFGTNCDNKCGHCLENVTCNSLNGHCTNGCALGYSGDFCNISTDSCLHVNGSCFCNNGKKWALVCNETLISPEKPETNTLTAVIGAGAGVFLLVFVGIIVCIIRQKRNKRDMSNEGTEQIGFSAMDESLIKRIYGIN